MRINLRIWVCAAGFVLLSLAVAGQYDPARVCRIENDRVVFTLDKKWTEQQKNEVMELFDLDSALVAGVFKGMTRLEAQGQQWTVADKGGGVFELSKPFRPETSGTVNPADLFLLIDDWMNFSGDTDRSGVVFGVNQLKVPNAIVYTGTHAQFFLPGYTRARNVYLSGSFNNWSTTQTPMRKAATGWITDVKLEPGKYAYKYIVDGRWTADPVNLLSERGDAGGRNSVLYCPNHTFRLNGYEKARTVVVAGNFNGWNPRGVPLERTSGGWALKVYLREGTHAYKFLVDGKWITDPGNPQVREDAHGNRNSFLEIGEPFLFSLEGFTDARRVILAGSFNHWDPNELVMQKTASGWKLPYVTAAGNYEYKFIIDGEWMPDPANPFTTGSGNYTNSFIALKANHIFELKGHSQAGSVMVSGSFNGWRTDGYRMVREGDIWKIPLCLEPGKYSYKFIVDGQWILDPANPLLEENQYGTGNSVLWIDPRE